MRTGPRAFIEILLTGFLLVALATALARRPPATGAATADITVVLNTKSLVYHCPVCELVRGCGPDCVTVDISEAKRRGGKPCTTCGGDCVARK